MDVCMYVHQGQSNKYCREALVRMQSELRKTEQENVETKKGLQLLQKEHKLLLQVKEEVNIHTYKHTYTKFFFDVCICICTFMFYFLGISHMRDL